MLKLSERESASATLKRFAHLVVKAIMIMNEVWKDIVGYEGLYQISSNGVVRIVSSGKIKKDKVLKGYHKSVLSKNGIKKWFFVHRLVAFAFLGDKSPDMEINHIDADKSNNTVTNLEWITHTENVRHACRLKLRSSVKGKPQKTKALAALKSELTKDQILDIVTSGLSLKELGDIYGLSQGYLSRIKSGKRLVKYM